MKIADREEAIHYAVSLAREGDIILLAGKGHENYQLISGVRHPYSEIGALKYALERRAEAVVLG